MDVQLPDGTIVKGVPDGTTKEQLAEKLKANGREVPAEWLGAKKRTPLEMVGRQVGLTARAALEGNPISTIGGLVGKAVGLDTSGALSRTLTRVGLPEPETATERVVQAGAQGMAGGAGMAKLSELGAAAATNPTARAVLSSMAKHPQAQISGGGAAAGASQITAEQGGGPLAQTLAGLGTFLAPGMLGKTPGRTSIRNPLNAERMATFKAANQAGYKFPPSEIERGVGREILESVGGKAATKQEAALHNQQVTNELARKGASIPSTQPLNEANLEAARDRLAGPYREVARVSPDAKEALDTWKNANAKAKLHWRDYERNQTAAAKEQYEYWNDLAEVSQQIMEGEAVRAGNPELVQRLREARVKIAQNWDVDRALNIGTGDVRANVLGSMLNKRGEKGMTGPLGTIARTQQAFPQYLGEAAKTSTPGVNQLASLGLGSIFGLEGYHSLGLKGGAAGLAAGLAIPQVSRGARAAALSSLMQKPLADQPGIPLSALTDFLAREQAKDERAR